MNSFTLNVFDDRLEAPTGGTSASVTTSVEYALVLGVFDQLAFVATAEQISGANAKLAVSLSHSADGMNWLLKPGTFNIPPVLLDPLITNTYVGFDDGIIPSLRLVRFLITLTGVGPLNAAVRLDVTANDVREGRFAAKVRKELQNQADANQCAFVIQGGSHVFPSDLNGVVYYGQEAQSAAIDAAIADEVGQNSGPLADYLSPEGDGYRLADDARLCVGVDGTVTMTNTKGGVQIATPASGGSSGAAPGSSTC